MYLIIFRICIQVFIILLFIVPSELFFNYWYLLFTIFNYHGIFNVRNLHTGPPVFSPLSEKAMYPISIPKRSGGGWHLWVFVGPNPPARHTYTHKHTHINMYTHRHVHINQYLHIHKHINIYIYTYTFTQIHVNIDITQT